MIRDEGKTPLKRGSRYSLQTLTYHLQFFRNSIKLLITADMYFTRILLWASIFIAVHCQLAAIVDKSDIVDGGTFTVTCDASRLNIPTSVNFIGSLSIERTVGTATFGTNIATYTPFNPPSIQNITNIPSGRKWSIQFTGGTASVNRATINITLVVQDAVCDDEGLYRCNATYYTATTLSNIDRSQNITALAKTEDQIIRSNPQGGNIDDYSENQLGESITLTCIVMGPQSHKLVWLSGSKDGSYFPEYPLSNDISTLTPTPTAGSCNQYRHQSTLNFTVQQDNIMYICKVEDSRGKEVTSKNFTIGIESSTKAPDQLPSQDESASANVGAIVGGVIGGLVLIAIIVIVVYFCWYRKRTDDGDKEVEATDNTHAPPPVFYAEPKKLKKDERDGVRPDKGFTNEALDNSYDDSKDHRGPPQYINTVDGEDLPRYEQETHRGRSNRGYDDENEKNEGHGRRHRRDRKDKEDRDDRKPPRKDYDDRDKGRHYSTDDGTDNRDPQMGYGDPNMGTSI